MNNFNKNNKLIKFFIQNDNPVVDTLYLIISRIYFVFIGCFGLYVLYNFRNMFLLYYVITVGLLFGFSYYKIYKNSGKLYLISLSYFNTTISLLLFLVSAWFSLLIGLNPGGHRTVIFSAVFSTTVTSTIIFIFSALWGGCFTLLTENAKNTYQSIHIRFSRMFICLFLLNTPITYIVMNKI